MSGQPTWVYGVFLSFAGCVVSNFGVNVQKMAHTQLIESGSTESYATNPLWITGMALMIVGSVADLISFGFAPMSLLAPIGALTLVVNMLIAPCFLKEKLSTRDVVFTLIICVGTIVCICFGSKEEGAYSIETLMDLYTHTPFVIFAIFLAIVMAGLFFLINQSAQREAKFLHTQWDLKFQAVAYPAVSGTVAALSVLFAKSSAEIIKESIKGRNQFTNFFSYVLIAMLLACLVLQMKWLNVGLTKADALFVIPVYQVFWVVMNVVTGMIYFEDYLSMNWTAMFFFILGIIITLFGVYFLTQRSAAVQDGQQQIEASFVTTVSDSDGPSRASDGSLSRDEVLQLSGGSEGKGASLGLSLGGKGAPRGAWNSRALRRGPSFLLGFHMSIDDAHAPADQLFATLGADLAPTVYLQNEQFSIINGM